MMIYEEIIEDRLLRYWNFFVGNLLRNQKFKLTFTIELVFTDLYLKITMRSLILLKNDLSEKTVEDRVLKY